MLLGSYYKDDKDAVPAFKGPCLLVGEDVSAPQAGCREGDAQGTSDAPDSGLGTHSWAVLPASGHKVSPQHRLQEAVNTCHFKP